MLNYTATKFESQIIADIAAKACQIIDSLGLAVINPMEVAMDLEVTHCNGCTLDLVALSRAPTTDLLHDVGGIRSSLNRRTGKLEGCFHPRYACKQ